MSKHGWTYKRIEEVCELFDSQRKPVTKHLRTHGTIPYYGANGIQDYVADYIFDGRYLLIGEDGARWGANEKTSFIIDGKSWVNNHAHILKTAPILNDLFLMHYLNYKDLSSYITGTIVPKLTQASLKKISVPVPSKNEQEAIVAELDEINETIELLKQQVVDLDALEQSIFYTMFGDPVTNEKGWEVDKLNAICDVRDGTHDSPSYIEMGFPLITSKNVINGAIDFDNVNYISKEDFDNISKRSRVDIGDIIMPMIGTIGRPAIVKTDKKIAIKNVALIKFVQNSSILNIFLISILSSPPFDAFMKKNNKGGTQKFIAPGDIRKLPIILPPLALQQEFAAKVEAIESAKAELNAQIAEMQTLLASRMDYYFG